MRIPALKVPALKKRAVVCLIALCLFGLGGYVAYDYYQQYKFEQMLAELPESCSSCTLRHQRLAAEREEFKKDKAGE